MIHDPMCPVDSHPDWDERVHCTLIAQVRADTLDSAAQHVERNVLIGMMLTPKEVRSIIAVIRGES